MEAGVGAEGVDLRKAGISGKLSIMPLQTRHRVMSVVLVVLCGLATDYTAAQSGTGELPRRPSPRPLMTTTVPHHQIGVAPNPRVHEALLQAVFALPDVENLAAMVVGARMIWLPDRLTHHGRRRGQVGNLTRGVGHIHADGSLHVNLPEERIRDVVNAEWGARHPSLDDYVYLFTPQPMDELAVTFRLVVEAYNYVTERDVQAGDYLALPKPGFSESPPPAVFVVEGETLYHTERDCIELPGLNHHETEIYDLGADANPHACVVRTESLR